MPVSYIYPYVWIVLEKGIVPNWWQGIYDQLLSGIINRLFVIFNFWNNSANSWTCQLYYYALSCLKLTKFKTDACLRENLTMAHWIRLSLLCRCKWTRKSQVSYRNVSEQYLLLCKDKKVYCVYTRIVSKKDVPRRTKRKVNNLSQITRFLCMHKILVHAQESWA